MLGTVRIDKADKAFSRYIRLRDKRCKRCGNWGWGFSGINGLQCSHFFGRRMESVRFDEENCDTLCFGCHRYWEKEDREGYRQFKIKQLGQKRFDLLVVRANTPTKKDRQMAYLYWKNRLKEFEKA